MKNDGGPAYPGIVRDNSGILETAQGVTVRDLFAIEAMQALIINRYAINVNSESVTKEQIAIEAYNYADAMIEAREN